METVRRSSLLFAAMALTLWWFAGTLAERGIIDARLSSEEEKHARATVAVAALTGVSLAVLYAGDEESGTDPDGSE